MSPTQSVNAELSREKTAKTLVYSSFVLAGIVTTLLGPILPFLISRWSLTDERAGLFFTLQFCGNLAGIASLGRLISRRGYGRTLVIGFALIAAGVAGLNLGNEFGCLFCTGVFGYGLGLVLSGSNLWVAEIAGSRRASALSILNVAWGIGAISCPLIVLLAQKTNRLSLSIFGIAGFSAVAAIAIATSIIEPRSDEFGGAQTAGRGQIVTKRTAIALGGLFFLYVGTEGCVGGWTASLAKRMGTSGNLWELSPMLFWAGLLVGRALAPIILRLISENFLMTAGLMLACIFNGGLLWATTFPRAAVCVVATGLGLSCVYPLVMAWMVGHYGKEAKRLGSIMFALACVGGAILPALVGYTSTHSGSLRAGLLVPFFACIVMLMLSSLIRKPIAND